MGADIQETTISMTNTASTTAVVIEKKENVSSSNGGTITTALPEVISGTSDWRNYRPIRLSNGVTCVLVHDRESKTTAMAVSVGTGASADPRSMSGLAHFCEHMCFLGSEAYPGENEYKRYLSCHGGRSNASTGMNHTTYKFDVLSEHAEKAVDIFSNFFVAPLFTSSGTSREVNAVDSENSKNLTADGRRRLQVFKALADPEHHYSKFSTGNAKTLPAAAIETDENDPEVSNGHSNGDSTEAERVREALIAFHKRHYRPSNMTVVIVGPQSLDTLESWVVPRFSAIQDKQRSLLKHPNDEMTELEQLIDEAAKDVPSDAHDTPLPPYNPALKPELQGGNWPCLYTILPLHSMRKLVLNFPLPSVLKNPDKSPVHILSHLLGHEGKGSCFAVLQDAGLLTSLSVGNRISAPDQCVLQISVALTEQGEHRWKEVVSTIFSHCGLIHRTSQGAVNGDASMKEKLHQIWDENVVLSQMHFHQTSPSQAYSFAPGLASSVPVYGTKACLSAGSMLEENKETLPFEELVEFASMLTPNNCLMERCSKAAWKEQQEAKHDDSHNIFGLKTEQWYGVDYYLSKIDTDDIADWERSVKSVVEQAATENNREDDSSVIGSLHLPTPNGYIPRSLGLCPDLPKEATLGPRIDKKLDSPNLIVDDNHYGRLWHRLDDRYALPKSSLTLLMRTPAVEYTRDTPSSVWSFDHNASIQSLMLTGAFSDSLAQDTYDADLAGLHWSLSKNSYGITLRCGGYSDKLPDLALKLLRHFLLPEEEEKGDSFLQEEHISATKDRVVRSLESFFQSRRADSHALYYEDLLLGSQGGGLETKLAATKAINLDLVKKQHEVIVKDGDIKFDCLFSGNVSEREAKLFFEQACHSLKQAKEGGVTTNDGNVDSPDMVDFNRWIPGPFQRRLKDGEDIELHFQSKNPKEENGAVLMTFQAPVPGYKGELLSDEENLKQSAAIRLLCHMLREPLFDELRTKQQLGYIVSSYYDVSFSSRRQDLTGTFYPAMTPIDSIAVNVLSRKISPAEVTRCIDEFLDSFRSTLETMPHSEIKSHSDSLSKKLLKPKQKLSDEVSVHFGKILRYASEVLGKGLMPTDLPWDSAKPLAQMIEKIERRDLTDVWDRVVSNNNRSRIVSHVYGSSFPMGEAASNKNFMFSGKNRRNTVIIKSADELFQKRTELVPFDDSAKRESTKGMISRFVKSRKNMGIAVALIGAGVVGLGLLSSRQDEKERVKAYSKV